MLILFASIRGLLKRKQTCTESKIFRLHCQWTVLILLVASLLLGCRQFFGDPIICLQKDVSRIEALQTFCWVHSTFILPHAWNSTIGDEVPHPGIDRYVEGQTKVYHAYYQWVALCLFLQSIMFYFPKYLWKCSERNLMKTLTQNLDDPLLAPSTAKSSVALLVKSIKDHWSHNSSYLGMYLFCEYMNLLNICGQILLIDRFLNGAFTTFGIKVFEWSNWDQEYRTDPLVETFPRMTKCSFHEFGSSGDVQRYDALCLLPLNILNEKIYIFLWFWFACVAGLTVIMAVMYLIFALIPYSRYCALVFCAPTANKRALEKILSHAKMSDWYILYSLAYNIESSHYAKIISHLASSLEQNGHVRSFSSGAGDENLHYV